MAVRTALVFALACAVVAEAGAHGTGGHTGFVATVSYVEPPLPGLVVRVIGGHERISVQNLTRETVVLFAADGTVAARLARGEAAQWADRRVGATGPPPDRGEFVRNWRIRGEADGRPFAIHGFLGYRPPPRAEDESFLRWSAAVAGVVGVAALAALALVHRRHQGESESEPTEP